MFERFIKRIKSIDQNQILKMAMADLEPKIEEMNRDQLWRGIDSGQNPLSPSYSEGTKKAKKKKGQPTNRVTLKDTGDFHKSIKAKAEREFVLIQSKHTVEGFDLAGYLDGTSGHQFPGYGQGVSIYGLTPDNLKILFKDLRPLIRKEFRNAIIR